MWKLISRMTLTFGMLGVAVADDTPPKPDVTVEFCGRLRHGVMVIGGECTGTTISVNRVIWEVQLMDDAERKFAKEHHKKTVVVTGSLRKVAGIETKDRWIIDVKKISKQDVTKNKPGVRMTIVGKLRPVNPGEATATSMTIDSAGQVWPIDLSSDATLKNMAATLAGQPVLLRGNLKQPTEDKPTTGPTLHVKTLKRRPGSPLRRKIN